MKKVVYECWWIFGGYPAHGLYVKSQTFAASTIHELMYPSISGTKLSVGQVLALLRHIHQPEQKALALALQVSFTTYLKTERGQRELSFLMALRICLFYKMDLHEFVSMLSDEELGRSDLSVSKAFEKRERKKAALLKAKVIDIKTEQAVHPSLL